MSTTSPREEAAQSAQAQESQYQQQFTNIAFPEIQSILSQVNGALAGGFGAEPANVKSAFEPLYGELNADYAQAGAGNSATIQQRARQSGNMYSTNQIADATTLAGIGLQRDQANATRQLQFQEASSGLQEYNQLVGILGGGANEAMQLGGGGLNLEMGAISGMSGMSQGQGAMGGAVSGASTGAVAGPWGALIGGVLGGAAGYMGSGG